MSWRKRSRSGSGKKDKEERREQFAITLGRIQRNDPTLRAASLRRLGLTEADAKELYNALKENTMLVSLDISRNHLRDGGAVYLSKIIRESTTLQTLNASFNEFSPLVVARFGPAVRRNVRLTKLLLEEKATIPGTGQKLLHSCPLVATARLRLELFLGENLSFERAICGSTTVLELKNRRLEHIPDILFGLHHLVKLNLSSNCLCRIPDAIGQLQSLEKLILSDNAIITVADEIATLSKLTVLDLSDNLLLNVSCAIANLPHLSALHLEGNLLHERWQLPCEELTRRLCDPGDALCHVAAPFVQHSSSSSGASGGERTLSVAFAAAGDADAALRTLQLLQKLCLCREPGVPKKKLAIVKRALDQFSLEELQVSIPRNLVAGRGAAAMRRLSYKAVKGGPVQRLNISFYDAFASGMVLSRTSIVTHEVVMLWLSEPLAQLHDIVSEAMLGLSSKSSRQFVILVGVLQSKNDVKSILAEEYYWKTPQHKMAAIARMAPLACTSVVVSLATGAGLSNLLEKFAQCPVAALAATNSCEVVYRRAVERLRSMAQTKPLSTESELTESLAGIGLVKSGDQRRVLDHARKLAIIACLPARGEENIYVHGLGHMPSVVRDLVQAAEPTQLPAGMAPCVPEATLRALLAAQWGLDEAVERAVTLLRHAGVICHLETEAEPLVLVLPALPPGRKMDLQLEDGHIRIFKFQGHPGHAFAKLAGLLLSDVPTDGALTVKSVFANRVVMSISSGSCVTVSLHVKLKSIFVSFVNGCDEASLQFVMRSIESVLEAFPGDTDGVDVLCPHCTAGRVLSSVVQDLSDGKISCFPLTTLEESIAKGQPTYICRVYEDWPVAVQMDKYMPDVTLHVSDAMAIEYSRLAIGKKIGEGGFADVFVAQLDGEAGDSHESAKAGRTVAVKVLRLREDAGANFSAFRKEVAMMIYLQHPQLVSMLGFTMNPPCIVSEFCPEGDLHEYLMQRAEAKSPLPMSFVLRVLFDLSKGLSFLHTSFPPMIHRDLKPANVLLLKRVEDDAEGVSSNARASLASEDQVVAKITDFGLTVQSTLPIESRRVLTPYWLAPEILRNKPYSCASDMFAFGIIAIQLLTLQLPYEELDIQFNVELEEAICSGARPAVSDEDLARLPPPVRTALMQTIEEDPEKRPTASEMAALLQHFVSTSSDDDDLHSLVEPTMDDLVTDMEELSDTEGDMLFTEEAEEDDTA